MVLTRKDIASLAAVSMVAMLSALDQTVVSTALPHILATLPGATLLGWVFTLTLAVQSVRVLAIWLAGRAVGVDLSPRPYYVMGPLLFLVLLVPFSVNGIAVRESFFVSFLGGLNVDADKAFATGFLFFAVTLCLSVPGGVLLAWQSIRGMHRPATPDHG